MCLLTFSGFPGGSAVKNDDFFATSGEESGFNAADIGSIPESRRSQGEGNGSPLEHVLPGTKEAEGLSPTGLQNSRALPRH